MKRHALHLLISCFALGLATGHLVYPNARIDSITLALFAIAIVPWLGLIFRSLELPGGWKVEYNDLKKVEADAHSVGLLAVPADKIDVPAYTAIAEQDPNLALAGLRIEIEKRLRRLATKADIDPVGAGIGQLIRGLTSRQAISSAEASVLNDIIGLLNNAVHGADVDARSARWAIEIGPELLTALDRRLEGGEGR